MIDGKVVSVLDPSQESGDFLVRKRARDRQYAFDYAFDASAGQEQVCGMHLPASCWVDSHAHIHTQVYNSTTRFLIDGVIDGYNATVFAYGATGSGKT